MTTRKILENKLRLLEVELSNQTIDMTKAMQAAANLEQQVEFTTEQIVLVKAQLDRCPE